MALFKHPFAILGALAICGAAALSAPATVGATTGMEETLPVQVTLSETGVKFSKTFHPNTDLTLQLRITNKGERRRSFRIGNRQTHALKKNQTEFVYFSFYIPGKVAWVSKSTGGKPFGGIFKVKPADRFGIPQG